jgi:hypothetical protein
MACGTWTLILCFTPHAGVSRIENSKAARNGEILGLKAVTRGDALVSFIITRRHRSGVNLAE